MNVNRALVRVLVTRAPQGLQQFLAANRAGAILNQVGQQLELLEGQHQRLTVQEHLAASQVNQHARGVAVHTFRLAGGIRLRVGVHGGRIAQRVTDHLKVATLGVHGSQRHGGVRLRFGGQVVGVSAQVLNDAHQGGAVCGGKLFIQTHVQHEAASLVLLSILVGGGIPRGECHRTQGCGGCGGTMRLDGLTLRGAASLGDVDVSRYST